MGKYRRAVFILAYKKEKNIPKYLLLKRKLHWAGWEFPKGGIDFLETKKHCAIRELKEETGLKVKKLKKFNFSGKYKYKNPLPDRKKVIGQSFSLFSAEIYPGKVILDKHEHSGFEWLTYEQAMKRLTWENQKECLNKVNNWLKN
jgi:DNA polymerase